MMKIHLLGCGIHIMFDDIMCTKIKPGGQERGITYTANYEGQGLLFPKFTKILLMKTQ